MLIFPLSTFVLAPHTHRLQLLHPRPHPPSPMNNAPVRPPLQGLFLMSALSLSAAAPMLSLLFPPRLRRSERLLLPWPNRLKLKLLMVPDRDLDRDRYRVHDISGLLLLLEPQLQRQPSVGGLLGLGLVRRRRRRRLGQQQHQMQMLMLSPPVELELMALLLVAPLLLLLPLLCRGGGPCRRIRRLT